MILVLGGTSTSGKSSIARELSKHKFVVISLDQVYDEIRPDIRQNVFRSESEPKLAERKEMAKRAKKAYRNGSNVVIDEVYVDLLLPFLEPCPVFTCLIYAPPSRLVENYKARKLSDYRSMRNVIIQFTQMYCKAPDGFVGEVDTVSKTDLHRMATCDKPSFDDKEDMLSFVTKIAQDMEIGISGKTRIIPRRGYDMIVINSGTAARSARMIYDNLERDMKKKAKRESEKKANK